MRVYLLLSLCLRLGDREEECSHDQGKHPRGGSNGLMKVSGVEDYGGVTSESKVGYLILPCVSKSGIVLSWTKE